MSEDMTFCADKSCKCMKCERNLKHIQIPIPHSFAMFTQCEKFNFDGAIWLFGNKQEDGLGNCQS
uniref:Uncharacterized protein n=1 Tax=Siphoviridae sp. ctX5W26 TaxID=2825540 RepID=A0A8S5UEK9_9CAUD|nr:MAG TPA: hypothetical protein [Siphoviridae sp. ctX5W26]